MASGSVGDPWDWSVDRIVQELCTDNRSWTPKSRTMSVGDPVFMEQIIREQEINGAVLLVDVDHDFLEKLGVKALGRRCFVVNAIDELRKKSTEYQSQAQNTDPVQRRQITELSTNILALANAIANTPQELVALQHLASFSSDQLREMNLPTMPGVALSQFQKALATVKGALARSIAAESGAASLGELLTKVSDIELQQLVASTPPAQLDQLKAALNAAQMDKSPVSRLQLLPASGHASTQIPSGIEDADPTPRGTPLVPEEPGSKRQKLDPPPASSTLNNEDLPQGLAFAAADMDEDLLRDIGNQTPQPDADAGSASPSSGRKRKRSCSLDVQESTSNMENDEPQIPQDSALPAADGKKRAALTFVGPNSARRILDYENEKAEALLFSREVQGDQAPIPSLPEQTVKETSGICSAKSRVDSEEQVMCINGDESGDEVRRKAETAHSKLSEREAPLEQVQRSQEQAEAHQGDEHGLSAINVHDTQPRAELSCAKQRPTLKNSTRTYLAKDAFPVDGIFYGNTKAGEKLTDLDGSDDFMLLSQDARTSQRTYVHGCMKSFLLYKPQVFKRGQEDQFTIVRPYHASLLGASGSVLQPEPSVTIFYKNEDGVVAERAVAPDYPELEERERQELANRKQARREYSWPLPNLESGAASGFGNNGAVRYEKGQLAFPTTHRGLMHPRSSRAVRGDAKFLTGLTIPRDPDDYLDALEKKWRSIPGGDKFFPVFGESDDDNDYDEETWKEICQEAGDDAIKAISRMRKSSKKESITSEEVNDVIEEALAVFKSRWKLKYLAKLERKAWALWTKSRKQGTKDDQLSAAKEALEHELERLTKLTNEFMSQQWSSKSEVRRVCGALEHTVFLINETRWTISVLEAKSAPPKSLMKLSLSKAKKKENSRTGDEDGESIGSDGSEDKESDDLEDMSDFVVSDDEDLPDTDARGNDDLSQQEFTAAADEQLRLEADADVEDEQDQDQPADFAIPDHSRGSTTDIETPIKVLQAPNTKMPQASVQSDTSETREVSISSPTSGMSTPTKAKVSAKLKLNASTNVVREVIDLTMSSPPIIDLVTPEKSEVERQKPRSTPVLKLRYSNSPFRSATPAMDEDKMPNTENLPPLDDPFSINKYSYQAWAKLSDADRILVKTFFNMRATRRAELFDYVSTLGFSDKGQKKFKARLKEVVTALNVPEDDMTSIQQYEFEILIQFIRLFYTFIHGNGGNYKSFKGNLQSLSNNPEKNSVLIDVLNGELLYFIPFWNLCCKMEGYFSRGYSEPSAPSTPSRSSRNGKGKEVLISSNSDDEDESPRSSVKRRRETTTSNSDVLAELSPHLKRKKKVHEDVSARDRREQDRERQSQQEQRRKLLQAKLEQSGRAEDLDLARIIINEKKEGAIQVTRNIAGRIKSHQMEGVRFMWDRIVTVGEESMEGCLLAHTMGLGKTLQTITLLVAIAEAASSIDPAISSQIPKSLQVSKTLVLCPASLVDNWMDELLTWAPDNLLGEFRKIDANHSMQERLNNIADWYEEGGILLIGYDMFRNIIQNTGKKNKAPSIDESKHDEVLKYLLQGPNIVVADEAHVLKNDKAGVTKAASRFRTKSRIALTGSPLANNVQEYYSMINFVAPGYLGSGPEFRSKYAEPIEAGLSQDSTPYEFRRSLKMLRVLNEVLGTLVHRADMSVLKNDLPPKMEFVITVPLTELQRKAYSLYVRSMLEGTAYSKTKTGEVTQATIWHWLTVLSLLCNHPACFSAKLLERKDDAQKLFSQQVEVSSPDVGAATDETTEIDLNAPIWKVGVSQDLITREMALFREEASDLKSVDLSYKVQIMCQILDAARDAGDKTLIFSQSIPALDYLEELCRRQGRLCARLDGKTQVKNRQGLTKKFNNGNLEICLISTGAGGLGLNLQSANRVIIFDFKFNPIDEEQAVGRAYRIGQKKMTYVYRFVAGGTFETAVHSKAVFKTQLASRVVDKKNPIVKAKRNVKEYLFEPRDVPPSDLSEFRGMDPLVLDKILATQGDKPTIRAIVQTDTFAQDNNDKLTAEEEKEALQIGREEKLRRSDPKQYATLQMQKQRQHGSFQPAGGGRIFPVQASSSAMPATGPFQNQSRRPSQPFANGQQMHSGQTQPRNSPGNAGIGPTNQRVSTVTSTMAVKVSTSNGSTAPSRPQQAPFQNLPVRQNDRKVMSLPPETTVPVPDPVNRPPENKVGKDNAESQPLPRTATSAQKEDAEPSLPPPSGASARRPDAGRKKPMSMEKLFQTALETIKGGLPLDLALEKTKEVQKCINDSTASEVNRRALKLAAFNTLMDNPGTCRKILTSKLSVENFLEPILSLSSQPTPSSSSSGGQIETIAKGQSAMYTAMARQPIRPPVQNLRTPVTKPARYNSSSSSSQTAKSKTDEEVLENVNRNRRLRGDVEIQTPVSSSPRKPRLPDWAEKELDNNKRHRRQDSRDSSGATPLPKKTEESTK